MRVMGIERRSADEGSASPGSVATDDVAPTPPSPCLHELGDDDATPRQQWSPVHKLVRAKSHPYGGCGGKSKCASSTSYPKTRAAAGCIGASSGLCDINGKYRATKSTKMAGAPAGVHVVGDRPDSPVMRVDDLERLDLSVVALGEERVCHPRPDAQELNPGTFGCGPGLGPIGPGGRPRSLGGRPSSRTHGLFVAPGHFAVGPSSPPSGYSTHSESGFTSPTRRVVSPGLPREQGRVRKGHWKKGKPIGVGSCGNVYLGMNDDTGELMAVKEITLEAKERLLCSLYNEIQVMHKLVHPHIVGYLGAELQDSQRKLCIFQEWVPAGSLHSLLDQFGALSDAMTRKYTGQVLEGLAYLHANRVIHRDVKSKNILVDDRGNVKLADFGCALVLKDDQSGGDGVEMSMKGTPLFMAPEMLLKRKCGRRVDVWSLGCSVLEMVTTRPPWADTFKHPVEIIQYFSERPGPPPLPANLAPGLRAFLLECFTWDPEVRPSAQELCCHVYLRAQIGPPAAGSSPGDDVPLEEMDRATAVTRMRRCSSATLDLLAVQARQAALGVGLSALAAFSTAPSGSFRPPSPRYGPGGAAGHCKRTPTRRRMYTEASLPPSESMVQSAITSKAAGLLGSPGVGGPISTEMNRRFSVPMARSPPISPDKPRRPGRGYSGGSTTEEDGRWSGSVSCARSRCVGSGLERTSSCRSVGGGEGVVRGSRGGSSASSTGSTTPQARSRLTCGSSSTAAVGVGGNCSTVTEAAIVSAVIPARKISNSTMPPLVPELAGVTIDCAKGGDGGPDPGPTSDSPPPTVRPLEVRPTTAPNGRDPEWPTTPEAPIEHPLLQGQHRWGVSSRGAWGPSSSMSDTRAPISCSQRHESKGASSVVGYKALRTSDPRNENQPA